MGNKRALVVDDSEINQLLLCKILETEGLTTEVAFNGLEAVEKSKDSGFDLVFMDVQMPEMDGYQATRLIKQHENGGNGKIIAVTASAMPEDEAKCLQAGMDYFITKPVQPHIVLDLVRKIFAKGVDVGNQGQGMHKESVQALYQKVHSDSAFFQELVMKFIGHYRTLMPKIKSAYEQEDFSSLKTHVHTLKGLVAALEAGEALDILIQIEAGIRNMQLDNVLILLCALETSVDQFLSEVNVFISS